MNDEISLPAMDAPRAIGANTSRTACSARVRRSRSRAVEYTRHMMRTTLTTVMMALLLLAFWFNKGSPWPRRP
ncbi:MAG: hypothetical protein BWY85_01966 [Firmicutes bacterium ADurb.Bin506]|nr:MAG: hypothetical protein BWY85_01966 [Firmicutes bacterium ADurb.Bin506]